MIARRQVRRGSALAAIGALALASLAVMPAKALAFTFNVNSEADAPDADITDPACMTLVGECTLRAAVMQANWLDDEGSHHTINVPAGTYILTIENTAGDENGATKGDLDLWQDTHIIGAGSSRTFIQASATGPGTGIDRLFELADDPIAVTIRGVTIRYGNSGGEGGGGISIQTINQGLRLENVVVERNTASNSGTAIAVNDGSLTIVDSVIRNNAGRNSTIEVNSGALDIRRTTIAGNETKLNASAFRLTGGSIGSIERSTISGNTSVTGGPVLAAAGSTLVIRNVTIASNTGPGAMVADLDSEIQLRSSTIATNDGIGIDLGGASDVRNTILAGNSDGNCAAPPESLGSNLETGSGCALDGPGDIANGLPKLGPLANNGGSTRTRALTKGSDAIDAGSSCVDVDQRGESRPKDGDGDGEAVCDIGAFEAPTVAVASPSPSAAPSAAPSEAPASAEPSADPGSSEPAATGPGATNPGATAPPASGGTGPSAAPSIAPIPASEELIRGPIPWIVIGVMALLTFLGIVIGLRRRSAELSG